MLRLIRNLIVIIALVLGVAFGFFNFQLASIDLLFMTTEAPLVLLLAIALVLGLLIAGVVSLIRIIKLRRQLTKTRRELKDARAEISNLRSMPIHDA